MGVQGLHIIDDIEPSTSIYIESFLGCDGILHHCFEILLYTDLRLQYNRVCAYGEISRGDILTTDKGILGLDIEAYITADI